MAEVVFLFRQNSWYNAIIRYVVQQVRWVKDKSGSTRGICAPTRNQNPNLGLVDSNSTTRPRWLPKWSRMAQLANAQNNNNLSPAKKGLFWGHLWRTRKATFVITVRLINIFYLCKFHIRSIENITSGNVIFCDWGPRVLSIFSIPAVSTCTLRVRQIFLWGDFSSR